MYELNKEWFESYTKEYIKVLENKVKEKNKILRDIIECLKVDESMLKLTNKEFHQHCIDTLTKITRILSKNIHD